MALSPQEAADLRKQLQEIERLSRLLNKNIDTTSLQDVERQAGNIRAIFAALTDEFEDLTGEIGYATAGFKKLVQEITNSNIGVRETTKAFNKLSSIAERIQSYQKGYSDLTSKDLKKLKEQFDVEKQRLFNTQDILKDKKALLEAEKQNLTIQRNAAMSAARAAQARNDRAGLSTAISQARSLENRIRKVNSEYDKTSSSINANNALLSEQDILLQGLEQSIGRTNDELKQQEKLLGLSGAVVGGLQKSLDKLGFGGLARQLGIDEAQDKMKALSRSIIENKQKEKNLQADINKANTRNLSAAQIRAGFGGKALKDQQKELDTLKASNTQYNGMSGKFKILQTGISSMGKSLLTNLKDPLSITLFLVGQIVDAFKSSDEATGNLAKQFNLTYKQASNVRDELNTIANLSMDNAVTTQGLQESMVAVGAALGSNARLNEADLVTMTKLTKQAGYTHDELMGIQQLSLINGKTLEDNTAEILGSAKAYAAQNKLVINEKEVLREVNKASASLKLSLGGSVGALAEAVVKSKQFGLNLEQAGKIADSLLQFEDSITSELEAELLIGKSFNFERARALALEGKTAEAAAEVAKQVGSAKDFGKLNVIQQEAIAKSMGMQRDELAQSLIDKEALTKLSAKEGESAQQAFNRLVAEVGMEEAKKRLGDEQLANQFEQQSVQERFNDTIEKLKEIFVSLVTPLMPVIDAFAEIFKIVGPIAGVLGQIVKYLVIAGKYILPLIAGFKTLQLSTNAIKLAKEGTLLTTIKQNIQERLGLGLKRTETTLEKGSLWKRIGSAVMSAFKAFAGLGPLGWILAGGAAAAVTALGYKFLAGNDVMSKGGYGKRTLMAPEGAIALNDKDTVIAGTNLFPEGDKSVNEKPMVSSPTINFQPMIDRLVAVENVLNQILAKETNVYMDSTKVGTALNVGAVKIQ
jgi:hypothetical protein